MFKSRRDYKKTDKVIDSCTTIHQLNTAMNMVYQYGKMYEFNHHWRKLDRKSFRMYMNHFDNVEYNKRKQEINEQETPVNPEG